MVDAWERERDYINIREITGAGAEMDLHWMARTLREVIRGKEQQAV